MTPRRLDAEGLELGGGLEVLLAAALEGMAPGGRLEVVSPSRGTALELHGWARRAGHATVGERMPAGGPYAVVVERGPTARVLADADGPRRAPAPLRAGGEFHSGDLRGGAPPPSAADARQGFTPVGALVERGAPAFHWRSTSATGSGPTTSPISPSRRRARSGTRRATSRGRRRATCPTTWSARSPRS